MFTRLEIRNWKNFKRVEVDLGERLFIAGPNASGKSNLLDVLRFLRDIADSEGGLQRSIEDRGGVSHLRSLYARQNPAISISVDVRLPDPQNKESTTKWSYSLEITQNKKKDKLPRVASEIIARDDVVIRERPEDGDERDPKRLTQTLVEQVNENRDFRPLVEFLASVQYLHIVPQVIKRQGRIHESKNDPYGGDFLERIVSASPRKQKSRLDKINKAIRVAVPQLKELKVDRDSRGVPHLMALMEHWRPNAGWQQEDELSDGTLRLMGLLWALLDDRGVVLLLEEPELSLHAAIVRHVAPMMASVMRQSKNKGRQVFVSTHSVDLLSDPGIGADEVLLLFPGAEDTKAQLASGVAEISALLASGVSAGEAILDKTSVKNAGQLGLFGR